MVIMAFDHEGVIAADHVPVGVSVTAGYYATFLRKKLRQKIRQNRPQLLESGALILHDNARPHIAQFVEDVMADYKWEVLPHPAYSPDMSPPDYDLFPKLKNPFRGQRFPILNALNAAVTRRIREINSRGELKGIQHLPQRWEAVIQLQGDYFERS
jgi:hypothetical protein